MPKTPMKEFLNHSRAGNLAGMTLALLGCLLLGTTAAQAAVESETVFVLNTFSFLVWGALVMWMCAGFTMLESGSVRTKNASMICLKNIGLYSIAGLVSITAAPNIVEHYWAVIIGAIGGILCTAGLKFLERVKLDDVVGAVPAHLFAGIWGTLAACIAGGGKLGVQLIGILAIGVFVFTSSWLLWRLLDLTLTARVTRQVEQLGQDAGELGIEAYPEFVLMPEEEDRD